MSTLLTVNINLPSDCRGYVRQQTGRALLTVSALGEGKRGSGGNSFLLSRPQGHELQCRTFLKGPQKQPILRLQKQLGILGYEYIPVVKRSLIRVAATCCLCSPNATSHLGRFGRNLEGRQGQFGWPCPPNNKRDQS